jgi:hypothetical protein
VTRWGLRVGGNNLLNLLRLARSPLKLATSTMRQATSTTEAACEYRMCERKGGWA